MQVKDLRAKIAATGQEILKGVNILVREGEVHAIMGKNGSGKSTLSKVLVGHPEYEVTGGSATYKGQPLFELEPEQRSHLGLFLRCGSILYNRRLASGCPRWIVVFTAGARAAVTPGLFLRCGRGTEVDGYVGQASIPDQSAPV